MYTSFFGLNEKPFTITPDPRYLFMSERHGEGLAHLVYGVTEGGGFIQLTGEVGTGKTTLVRTLLGQIPAEVDIALILNPQLSALEFLMAICEELGLPVPKDRRGTKALVDALNRYLLQAHSRGRRIILLIDEAQNLSEGVLEQLRLLTNLETARQKLLQIILIAQPELREKLAQESLRQLAQRVTGRYHLEPLSSDEAEKYIDHRLRVAGALTEIFTPAAKKEVFRLSGGVPRLMNVICDRALLGAYSRETRTVDKKIVRKAASEVSGQTVAPGTMKWAMALLGAAGIVLAATVLWPRLTDNAAGNDPVTGVASEQIDIEPVSDDLALNVSDAPLVDASELNLDQLLAEHEDSAAFADLFELWDGQFDASTGPACEQATEQGLSCYFQRGSWSTLRQLNRPALITLTDNDGESRQVVLTGLDASDARILIAGKEEIVPVTALTHYWFGQFMLLWKPPTNSEQMIGPGARGPAVVWLRNSLAALNGAYPLAADPSDTFDDDLAEQLQAFQRKHRLDADGIAGLKTQIIINALLEPDTSPRLTAGL